jgi:hypothetical protein
MTWVSVLVVPMTATLKINFTHFILQKNAPN